MALSGTTYFFVGFVTCLVICVVLPAVPKALNEAIAKIKTEQQKIKEEKIKEDIKDGYRQDNEVGQVH